MTLSIVVPAWTGSMDLLRMEADLIESIQENQEYDELIICEDGGWTDLHDMCDLYLWHPNIGDVRNTVLGLLAAKGDYIAVVNTDVIIHRGQLKSLSRPGKLVCGQWREQSQVTSFNASLFVTDRKVFDEYGYYDLNKKKSADYEYADRIKSVYEWSDEVEYTHLMGRSYSEMRRQADARARGEKI